MGLVLWFFHFLPWSVNSQKFSRGNSLLLETTHESASALYVWTHLFQICQKYFWNVQTKSPWLMAAGCFISLGSHTRRPSTTISFHSWELWFATGVRARIRRKPRCFLPRCCQPFQESLSETVKRTEKDCCHSMRFLTLAEGPQPAQLWRTTFLKYLYCSYYVGHFHSHILHFIFVLSLC